MKSSLRLKADKAKELRCKNLIVVLENPKNLINIGSVLRNIDCLGAEKLYVVDGYNLLPNSWEEMRRKTKLNNVSCSAVKWVFTKKFKETKECLDYLEKEGFVSIGTSPHIKGKQNYLLEDGNYTNKKIAVWFGNEVQGLSDDVINRCKFCISIKMAGIVESLNLGTTSGIVIHEIVKQRRNFKKEKFSLGV